MDRKFLTVLGVSLVFALIVSTIFYRLVAQASVSNAPPPEIKMKDLVVAAKPLPIGGMIAPADVKIRKVSADQFPNGAFSKVEEVIDRPLTSNILLDEPIQEGRLAARGSGLGIAPIIPIGMRAVTIRVTEVVGVAGFVLPGMRVDILLTGKPPEYTDIVTKTVLQNVTVISAGQHYQPDAKGEAINASTVTLLCTPSEAETITLASQEGRIQLVLRNGADHGSVKTPGREVTELFGGRAAPRLKPVPVAMEHRPSFKNESKKTERAVPVMIPVPPPADEIIGFRGTVRSVEAVGATRK